MGYTVFPVIRVTAPGTAAAAGDYAHVGQDGNGNEYWKLPNASFYVFVDVSASHWSVGTALDGAASTILYAANGTATGGPETATAYNVVNGMSPAPVVSGVSVAAPGSPSTAAGGANRLYSTGVLEATVNFGTGPQTLTFALVQDATISCQFQEKAVYGAAQVSRFSQATGYHDGMWSVKINAGEFSSEALQLLAALRAGQSGPGYIASVITDGEITIPEFSGTFTASAVDGTRVIWQFRRLLSKGATLPFKLSDFLYSGLDLMAVGDASGGIVDLLVAV